MMVHAYDTGGLQPNYDNVPWQTALKDISGNPLSYDEWYLNASPRGEDVLTHTSQPTVAVRGAGAAG